MEKEVVELKLDYMQGPIWISDVETGEPLTGIDIIDNDLVVKDLNYKIFSIYSSFYEYDSFGVPLRLKEDVVESEKDNFLNLVKKLYDRLNLINDGSYEVIDKITQNIKVL